MNIRFKLESPVTVRTAESRVSAEWDPGWPGPDVIVEVRETATEIQRGAIDVNTTSVIEGPKIVVRAEEVLIVVLVLILWIGAIVLFFNRWGKIRMLEPYQPKFQQQHRASCPLADMSPLTSLNQVNYATRASVSKPIGVTLQMPTTSCGSGFGAMNSRGGIYNRPRQNSVFVGPHIALSQPKTRKTQSAIDIHSLVLNEGAEIV